MQRGFAPIIVILILIALSAGLVVYFENMQNREIPTLESSTSPTPIATDSATPAVSKLTTTTPTTVKDGKTPPTSNPVAPTSVSNPYDLTSATGSVRVMVKAQSGVLAYIPQAELSTVSGFKVLDGRSTDKMTLFGKDRTDELRGEIIFSTAPPGPYKVRILYNGSWSGQQDVTVSSAKQSNVDFTVAGSTPTPTPTSKPIATCQVNADPKSGSAPLTVNLNAAASIYNGSYITAAQWDFDGDGSWDTDMSASNAFYGFNHTFTAAGTYNVKLRVQIDTGYVTDPCGDTTIVVTP